MLETNNSRVLFNNKTYENNSANRQDVPNPVRSTNNPDDANSSGETNRTVNSNPARTEPTLDLSRAGTAVLDNNTSNIAPVEINFGDPSTRRTNSPDSSTNAPAVNTSTPSPRTYQMTVGSLEYGNSFNISPNLYTSFNNSLSNSTPPKIDHNELNQLGNTAAQFGNREDIAFVANLRYQGSATVDARSRQDRQVNVTGPDARPISFEVDTQAPRPASAATNPGININLEEFAQTTIQTVGRSIGPIIIEEYNRQHPASRFTNVQPFTIPPAPAEGFSVSNNSGIDSNNRYNLGVGFQYTQRAFGETTFNLQASYNTPLFEVPSFITAGRVGQPYQPGREGLSITGSINVGDTGVVSYNSETGWRAAANFDVSNDVFIAAGYNQETKNQGGFFVGVGRRF